MTATAEADVRREAERHLRALVGPRAGQREAELREDQWRAIEALAPTEFEEVVTGADGPRTSLVIKVPLLGADGAPFAVCGIATDYCVKATALDAVRHDLATTVLLDLTAAVDPTRTDDVVAELTGAGVQVVGTGSVTST